MTTPANQTTQTSVVVAPKREIRVVEDNSVLIMDTAKFEHCYRIAQAMSKASLIPKHLKGKDLEETAANCFLVVNQALRWRMDPFAVAPETYEVGGKLGYQGKLVAAVINTRAGLADKLSYEFSGKRGTDDYTVTVSGRFDDEQEPRTVSVSVGQAKTQNQMWTRDPEQKLVYTGSIRWARRHAPEIIMGVTTDDDLEFMREEAELASMKRIKAPVFDGPPPTVEASTPEPEKPRRKRPTLVEEPLDTQKPVEQTPVANSQAAPLPPETPTVPPPSNETPGERELRELNEELSKLCTSNAITEDQLIAYMRKEKWLKEHHKKPSDLSSNMLKGFVKGWTNNSEEMVKRIKAIK